jgi:DNA-binding NarL/FixJ family response regulator
VLLLTSEPTAELHDAIMAHPDALLYKSAVAEGRICEEIVALVEGREDSFGQELLRDAMRIAKERPELSPSELAVLRCAAEDESAKEIAAKLGRKVKQVQNQVQAIHKKLEVSTTTGAVAKAYETGLLRQPRGTPPLPRPDRSAETK